MFHNKKFGMVVDVIDKTQLPQTIVYLKMHQCYSDEPIINTPLDEAKCGDIIVKRLLIGNRGHYSPLEGAKVTLSLQYIPHSVLQQLLRSRIGVSPSVQSFRYTSKQFQKYKSGVLPLEHLIYVRPPGIYHDRDSEYEYTDDKRVEDLSLAKFTLNHVIKSLKQGMPPEQARSQLLDYRQHCAITLNARSLMSLLDRRSKKDAQIEIQILASLIMEFFKLWMPEVALWYEKNRYGKAMLSP
mgnify:CR=1 FL=1